MGGPWNTKYTRLRIRGWPLVNILYWSDNQGVAPCQYNILVLETKGGPWNTKYTRLRIRGWPFVNILYWYDNQGWPLLNIIYWSEKQRVASGIQNILGCESGGGPFPVYYIGLRNKGWPLEYKIY